jgi:hypothetical protein
VNIDVFEMWFWKGMENISWANRVKTKVLHIISKEIKILRTIKLKKANWIEYSLRRNCLIKRFIEEKMEAKKTRKKM